VFKEKVMPAPFRRLFPVFAAALFLMILSFPRSSAAFEFKKEYKLQVTVGPNFYWGRGAAKFADLVREKTGGRINIKPYYGSALLQGAQLKSAQLVAKGAIDCAFESTINISSVIPECNVFSLPFFVNTYENLDKLTQGRTGQIIFDAMQKKQLMPLAWGENGFRQITNDKIAIRRPQDLSGMKVRVVGSPIFIDIFRQLGADPVNMNWGDAISAFQQGVVDAQENPAAVLMPVQIWQYHHYATFWNYMADPLIFYWNKGEWDQFPKDIRQAITEAAHEAGRFEKALCRAGLDGEISISILKNEFQHTMEHPDPVGLLQSNKMTVTQLTEEEQAAFAAATRPVFEKWAAEIGEDLVEAARRDMRGE
jgi:tripartite ATP-independent transporter DctP family solute receptor